MPSQLLESAKIFLSFTVGVSIFGASIFTVIVSEIAQPGKPPSNERFDERTVRTLLAISWLLFVLALGIGGVSINLLTGTGENPQFWSRLKIRSLILLLQSLIIGAFLILSLVIVAYTGDVGWVAVAFSSVAELIAVIYFFKCLYDPDAATSTVYSQILSTPQITDSP